MSELHVAASIATETTTGVDRGLDVDVTVTLPDGSEVDGEVTLVPNADGTPGYEAYGMGPDFWVSGPLLRALQGAYKGDDEGLTEALREIERAAAKECRAH